MTVVMLNTRQATQWHNATELLRMAVDVARHPGSAHHADVAERLLRKDGVPTRQWADRMAAIVIMAARRSDTAPTIQRRHAYRQLEVAAGVLIDLARQVHGVEPSGVARAELALLHEAAAQGG
jgi:hypothetical protein